MLVVSQLEVRECVGAVRADEVDGRLAELGVGKAARRGQRPKQHVRAGQHGQDADRADREIQAPDVVAKRQGPPLPDEQVARLAHDRSESRVSWGSDPHPDPCDEHTAEHQHWDTPERAAEGEGVVLHVERATSGPEQRGGGEVDGRLLEVQPLRQIENPERDEQRDREVGRAAPAAAQVDGRHEQHRRGGDRKRVRRAKGGHRLDMEQRMPSPLHVRRERRGEIDCRHQHRRECGDGRQRVGTMQCAQRVWSPVHAQSPRGRVAA